MDNEQQLPPQQESIPVLNNNNETTDEKVEPTNQVDSLVNQQQHLGLQRSNSEQPNLQRRLYYEQQHEQPVLQRSISQQSNLQREQSNNQQDNDSVFLPDLNSIAKINYSDCYLNKKFVNKKFKKKLPKNKKQIITCLNNNPHLLHANCLSLNNLSSHQQLNSGQFILAEHSFTVMEESTDEELKSHTLNNYLNHIAINYDKNNNQNELKISSPNIVHTQPSAVTSSTQHALLALEQRKHLQQQQLQQIKEQNAKQLRNRSKVDALNGLIFVLSAIYAKLIVILGLCFPIAETISHRIPIIYYEGFYLYLYLGSIFYLAIIYMSRESSKHKMNTFSKIKRFLFWSNVDSRSGGQLMHENSFASNYTTGNMSIHSSCSENDSLDQNKKAHFGSFYLRLGAVAFGIGSMIYSGLEFGQFFELENKEQCYSFLLMILPSTQIGFTFFQLYFLFMNSKSLIIKHRYLSRFGRLKLKLDYKKIMYLKLF